MRQQLSGPGLQPSRRVGPSTRLLAVTAVSVLMVTAAGCGGSPNKPTTQPSRGAASPATAASNQQSSPTTQPASHHATAGALSGTWNGQYSGSYGGTFHLSWRETGSKLHGTIHLSAPATTLSINGSVSGGSIRFGTVGSYGINYRGSLSGSSMSGSYTVVNGGSGTWSASRA